MEFVQPIREKEKIEEFKNELLKKGSRNYIMFVLAINTGLRIYDVLNLTVADVRNQTHIINKEQKTGKERRFLINSYLKEELDNYTKKMHDHEYLFKSRNGNNRPLTRVQAYRIINDVAEKLDIKDRIGTHSLRKTFGYFHYKQFKDVAVLQSIYNHSSPSITLRYIGINDDIRDQTIENFCL